MEADKKTEEKPKDPAAAPPASAEEHKPGVDALGKPEDSGTIDATTGGSPMSDGTSSASGSAPAKKQSGLKKFFKRFNVYFLFFILVIVIGGAFTTVSYLNGRKTPASPSVSSQNLSTSQLKQLANSNATVGGSGETLTIQGNAVFSGNILVRSNLDVAGTIESGGPFDVAQLTVSNSSNLANTQASTLQVASTSVFQGLVTIQNGVDVSGNSSFSGSLSVSNLTVTNMTMAGNAVLTVPNHIAFSGASPGRTIDFNVLGNGGSASVFGSDTSGTVTINTGNNPQAGCFIDLKFDVPFLQTPNVIIGPINQGAGETQFYAIRSLTDLQICTVNPAPANSVFAYSYFVTI